MIDVVRNSRPVTGSDEKDATVIRFGRQLFGDKDLDSATFARAVELCGKRGAINRAPAISVNPTSFSNVPGPDSTLSDTIRVTNGPLPVGVDRFDKL